MVQTGSSSQDVVRTGSCRDQRRRWESNPLETALQAVAVPSGSSVVLIKRPRQESNLGLDLRRVVCESGTPRGRLFVFSASPRNRTSSCSFEGCRAIRHTREATHSPVSRPGLEPGPGASEAPMRSARPSGRAGRRREAVGRRTRTFFLRPQFSGLSSVPARARGVEPRPPALETGCSPRSTLVWQAGGCRFEAGGNASSFIPPASGLTPQACYSSTSR